MSRPSFYLCFNVEGTLIDPKCPPSWVTDDFHPEIFEVSAIILDSATVEQKGAFQSFCRPAKNPKLEPYCLELTEISQTDVDKADEFVDVWGRFTKWMHSMGLQLEEENCNFLLVTNGPFHCDKYLLMQLRMSKIPFPHWALNYVELKTEYKSFKGIHRGPWPKVEDMLTGLGLPQRGSKLSNIHSVADVISAVLRRRGEQYVPKTRAQKPLTYKTFSS